MRSIPAQKIQDCIRDMIIESNTLLAPDVVKAFEDALLEEELSSAREVLSQLLENAKLARDTGLALCQDTGTAVFFVEMGEDCCIEGGSLREVINKGMVEGYEQGFLRKSMCHPLTRKNTGDNRPAVIHFDLVPGDEQIGRAHV